MFCRASQKGSDYNRHCQSERPRQPRYILLSQNQYETKRFISCVGGILGSGTREKSLYQNTQDLHKFLIQNGSKLSIKVIPVGQHLKVSLNQLKTKYEGMIVVLTQEDIKYYRREIDKIPEKLKRIIEIYSSVLISQVQEKRKDKFKLIISSLRIVQSYPLINISSFFITQIKDLDSKISNVKDRFSFLGQPQNDNLIIDKTQDWNISGYNDVEGAQTIGRQLANKLRVEAVNIHYKQTTIPTNQVVNKSTQLYVEENEKEEKKLLIDQSKAKVDTQSTNIATKMVHNIPKNNGRGTEERPANQDSKCCQCNIF